MDQAWRHLEGMVFGPIFLLLAFKGGLSVDGSSKSLEHLADETGINIRLLCNTFDLMERFGWSERCGKQVSLTREGQFAASSRRALSYGMILSYLPTFSRMDDFLFGDPSDFWQRSLQEETQVIRELNVIASGHGHEPYFSRIEPALEYIFNRRDAMPSFVMDTGCGDGALLDFIYEYITRFCRTEHETLGADSSHEIPMIGVDLNQESRRVAKAKLDAKGIPNHILFGDVSDPDRIAVALDDLGLDMRDGLHVRSFVDHDRGFSPPQTAIEDSINYESKGTFAYRGEIIDGASIIQGCIEHLSRWAKYVHRHGLLLIEHHLLDEAYIAKNLGTTIATSHDSIHGWSDQHSVEYPVWEQILRRSGFHQFREFEVLIPHAEAPNVSINYLLGACCE